MAPEQQVDEEPRRDESAEPETQLEELDEHHLIRGYN